VQTRAGYLFIDLFAVLVVFIADYTYPLIYNILRMAKKTGLIWTLLMDEGTSSPFVARLLYQVYKILDTVSTSEKEKNEFKASYNVIFENARATFKIIKKLRRLRDEHEQKLKNGMLIRIESGNSISILEPIDDEYRECVKDFFIKGEIAIEGIIALADAWNLKIDFFFKKEKKFDRGSIELIESRREQGEWIIENVRWARDNWYEKFNETRNLIIHHNYHIPNVRYDIVNKRSVVARFPTLEDGRDILEHLEYVFPLYMELIEECVVFILSTRMQPYQHIKEIPENERNHEIPIRYEIYANFGDKDIPMM
jgi:hypothetical protein